MFCVCVCEQQWRTKCMHVRCVGTCVMSETRVNWRRVSSCYSIITLNALKLGYYHYVHTFRGHYDITLLEGSAHSVALIKWFNRVARDPK